MDHDRGAEASALRTRANETVPGAPAVHVTEYADEQQGLRDLRLGRLDGLLTIPEAFSRGLPDAPGAAAPRLRLRTDNSDGFVAAALGNRFRGLVEAHNEARLPAAPPPPASLDVVALYPHVPYIQYVLAGSITLSIFMMVTIGGGIIYIDDRARGLHEGYLVTPITKFELIVGFSLAGAIMALIAGTILMSAGALLTGIPQVFAPLRMVRMTLAIACAGFALVSLTFLLVVRIADPYLPRAIFAVLNILLFFPSGAVYPQQAFPAWMQALAAINPFTYAVHAFRSLLLRDAELGAIQGDLMFLTLYAVAAMVAATMLFKRTL